MRNRLPLALSVTALVVAVLGATPYGQAAMQAVLPKNSVGTLQLKANAVTSAKIKNGQLVKADFKAGTLLRGPTGPAGPAGGAGPAGPTGPAGVTEYASIVETSAINSTSPKTLTATCPAGKKLLAGGGLYGGGPGDDLDVYYSYPDADGTKWYAGVRERTATANNWYARIRAVCGKVN